ncbi:benzoylsuccinyl-CoA thiolase [Iamia sp. SCSIO 61187]|uniref:Zn-ribbon domain-containing OB-fold protein n=1 Tax=Iamia sp. SCSIO 61187 TaxID=2722752 RepID=UPI001C6322AE|nr:zinc ribbon domain-containing protein [Iamia sp. SCSIO 61187]QYG93763.1 benzoylsuccinyl-CoA thiolase [Iamia sp. SCSIO 61187]
MPAPTPAPALGADGWFTTDPEPALVGHRCPACGTIAFPRPPLGCPNPACGGDELEPTPLSRRGTIWSYTDARYRPPPPYVVPGDEHVPFCIVAVELAAERLIVLGQVVAGVTVDELVLGQEVELVVDTLFTDDEVVHQVHKWSPVSPEVPS